MASPNTLQARPLPQRSPLTRIEHPLHQPRQQSALYPDYPRVLGNVLLSPSGHFQTSTLHGGSTKLAAPSRVVSTASWAPGNPRRNKCNSPSPFPTEIPSPQHTLTDGGQGRGEDATSASARYEGEGGERRSSCGKLTKGAEASGRGRLT